MKALNPSAVSRLYVKVGTRIVSEWPTIRPGSRYSRQRRTLDGLCSTRWQYLLHMWSLLR